MNTPKVHLFVCTNSPDRADKCGSQNAEALRQSVKKRCGALFGKDVRVNASGCLGQCERGIAAVIYPDNEWYFDLEDKDENLLVEAVKKAVERRK